MYNNQVKESGYMYLTSHAPYQVPMAAAVQIFPLLHDTILGTSPTYLRGLDLFEDQPRRAALLLLLLLQYSTVLCMCR